MMHRCPQCDRVLATEDGLRVHQSISHAPVPVPAASVAAPLGGWAPPTAAPLAGPAPGGWRDAPPPAATDRAATPPPDPAAASARLATRTVVGIILVNLLLQGLMVAITVTSHLRTRPAIILSLVMGLLFYVATVIYVTVRAGELEVRPVWVLGSAAGAARLGLCIGAGAAALLSALTWAAAGHAVVDPIAGLLSDESLGLLVLGFGVVALVAPLVEEMVFRGFLAEALRRRGAPAAIVLSAAAFSLAHLRFAQFRYYLLMGVAFGLIYWKRGLVGSVSAHAGFNATLILVAILAAHGPATTVHADGLTLRLPGSWHQAHPANHRIDLAALGPGEAQLQITHLAVPAGSGFTLQAFSGELQAGHLNLPGATFDPATVRVIQLPLGPALRLDAEVNGHPDETALLVYNGQLVDVEMMPNGSTRASQDFDRVLRSLRAG